MFKYFLVTTYSLERFSIDFCQKQSQLGSVANQNKGENRKGSLTSQKKNNQTVRGIGKRERESLHLIAWESDTNFLNQSQSEEKQDQ